MLSTEVTHSFYASLTTRSHKHCRSFADSRRSKVPANRIDKTLRTAQLRCSEDNHLLTLIRIHRSLGLAGKDRSRP
jgi:hypothetical protein